MGAPIFQPVSDSLLPVPFHLGALGAGSANITALKAAAAARIYDIVLSNNSAAARFVRFWDKASAPTLGTDAPKMTVEVPAGQTVSIAFPVGKVFALGLYVGLTTAAGELDATIAGIAATDMDINVDYC